MLYPKISIVTPTYNSSRFLEDTILSVINQNYPNLEYFIIDGGSNDGTIEIIKKYESHLSGWISEPDKGMYFAIQKGFDKSTGEIMAWLNSDDKYKEGTFKVVNQIFSTFPEIDWIIGMPSYYNEEGLCVKVEQQRKWAFSRFLLGDYRWIQQESVFFRRSLWLKAGAIINTSYAYAADFELWCRYFMFSKLYPVTTSLSGFRLHGNQISLVMHDEYENEVRKILSTYSYPYNLRFILLRIIWNIRTALLNTGIKPFVLISQQLVNIVDRLHNFPGVIFYDFSFKQWVKK